MSDKLFDTQELSEIRKLIGDEEPKQPSRPSAAIPPQSSSDYDLNQIIAEVSGTVDKTAKTPRPQPRVSQRTGAVPRVNSQRHQAFSFV